jgi:hypothetical protein
MDLLQTFKSAKKLSEKILSKIASENLYVSRSQLFNTSNKIVDECIKQQQVFSISGPLCISINNEIEFFCDLNDEQILCNSDLIKVEFILSFLYNKKMYYYNFGRTIGDNISSQIYNQILKTIHKTDLIQIQEEDDENDELEYTMTNDELQLLICDIYSKFKVYSIVNNTSYEQKNDLFKDDTSKYIKINYKRESDEEKDNFCFDLENNEVYSLNLFFTKNEIHSYPKIKDTFIYNLNKNYFSLKLKVEKDCRNLITKNYKYNLFNTCNLPLEFTSSMKSYGIKSLFEKDLLDSYPCSVLEKESVYMIKMTLIIFEDKLYFF